MALLPKTVVDRWKKLKHDLIPFIDKLKGPTVDDAFKKELKKKVTALYDQFDSGLGKSLKTATEAKTDKDAVLALGAAIKSSTDYLAKTKTAQAAWGTNGRSIGDTIADALTNIKEACETTLKAIAAKK